MLTIASACCDDCLKVHVCVRIQRNLRFRSPCVWCSCVVARNVRSPSWMLKCQQLKCRERDRFLRPGVLLRTSVRLAIRPQVLYQQRHPQNRLYGHRYLCVDSLFMPAGFLLSLRCRERYCHALYVSAVPVGGCFQTRDGLPRTTRAALDNLCSGS